MSRRRQDTATRPSPNSAGSASRNRPRTTAGVGHTDPPPPQVSPEGRHWGIPVRTDDAVYLPLPARIGELAAADPVAAAVVRGRLRDALPALFADRLVAVSCRRLDTATSVYRFAPDVP